MEGVENEEAKSADTGSENQEVDSAPSSKKKKKKKRKSTDNDNNASLVNGGSPPLDVNNAGSPTPDADTSYAELRIPQPKSSVKKRKSAVPPVDVSTGSAKKKKARIVTADGSTDAANSIPSPVHHSPVSSKTRRKSRLLAAADTDIELLGKDTPKKSSIRTPISKSTGKNTPRKTPKSTKKV